MLPGAMARGKLTLFDDDGDKGVSDKSVDLVVNKEFAKRYEVRPGMGRARRGGAGAGERRGAAREEGPGGCRGEGRERGLLV